LGCRKNKKSEFCGSDLQKRNPDIFVKNLAVKKRGAKL
jgi:hypothetical protein